MTPWESTPREFASTSVVARNVASSALYPQPVRSVVAHSFRRSASINMFRTLLPAAARMPAIAFDCARNNLIRHTYVDGDAQGIHFRPDLASRDPSMRTV